MRELERVQDRLLERDALHAQRTRPREVEQLRGERVEPHGLFADELAGAPRLVPRREALLHHRGRAADHAERIAHLVGDAGGEASDRRELLVLERRALRRLERAQLALDRGGVLRAPARAPSRGAPPRSRARRTRARRARARAASRRGRRASCRRRRRRRWRSRSRRARSRPRSPRGRSVVAVWLASCRLQRSGYHAPRKARARPRATPRPPARAEAPRVSHACDGRCSAATLARARTRRARSRAWHAACDDTRAHPNRRFP